MKKMICKPATMDAVKEKKNLPSKPKAEAARKKKTTSQEEAETSSGIGILFALEPRVMFDGAALATGAEVIQDTTTQDQTGIPGIDGGISLDSYPNASSGSDALWTSGLSLLVPSDRKEIVFIDTSVDDFQTLMEGIDPNAEVILLDSTRDGIEQIAEILGERTDIDAIHIISHGNQGELYLGTGTLSMESMQGAYTDELAIINQALTEEADFLIYGCNFGEAEVGQEAASLLAELTGADIAASNDLTGSTDFGGDWDLEVQTGTIESAVIVNEQAQEAFASVLATVTVDTTNDASNGDTSSIANLIASDGGDGISLREAIEAANNTTGTDTIDFNITGGGPHTIALGSALPTITDSVIIDGRSEPDYVSGTPVIRIDGASAGAGVDGLSFTSTSDGSTVRGLMITTFSRDGILVQSGADNITISGNWIGTTGSGSIGVGNGDDGIELRGSLAVIGGMGADDGNVITNTGDEGINIVGSGVTGHIIQGNYIGLDPDGSSGSGNTDVGIAIISGSGNLIGGTTAAARNVISNNFEGIEINTSNNIVQGNYIGTDATGLLDRGNRSDDGVEIQGSATGNLIGGTAAGAENVISGNAGHGIYITGAGADGNTILGNYIGTNFDGTAALGNTGDGVRLNAGASGNFIGDAASGVGNVISANTGYGVNLIGSTTSGNSIAANLFGLNAAGTSIAGLLNGDDGINVSGAGGNTIGGSTANSRNVINAAFGNAAIDISGSNSVGTTVRGNYIGTDSAGTTRLSGSSFGISVSSSATNTMIGGTSANDANVIAGYAVTGISVSSSSTGTTIQRNYIGTDVSGTLDLNTGLYGISVQNGLTNTLIGGSAAGAGNTIAFHSSNGIHAFASAGTGISILSNEIYGNGGLAIDLNADGVTANDVGDGDVGPNDLLNFPVFTNVVQNGANLDIDFDVDLAAGNYRIEFFDNASGLDGSGFGEGETFIGFVNITATGAAGYESFSTTLSSVTASNVLNITTTATEADGTFTTFSSTSEFGPQFLGAGALEVTTTSDSSDGDTSSITALLGNRGADGEISLREAITAANNTTNGTNPDEIHFNIAGVGPHTITPGSALPNITDAVIIDGTTEPDFAGTPVIELDGSSAGSVDGLRLSAGSDGSTIRGLAINRFLDGIELSSANNVLESNFIGTDVTGTADLGNTRDGIGIGIGGTNNTIGGTTAAQRNIISGNDRAGIWIDDASGNTVSGNYIGTDVTGTLDLGNSSSGVQVRDIATGNTIGGTTTAHRNVISGNDGDGISISNGADSTTISANIIGLDVTGTSALGNGNDGVEIGSNANTIGGLTAGERNIISESGSDGITISSGDNNLIIGNFIGTDITGTIDLGNTSEGLLIVNASTGNTIGGNTAGHRNVISGNNANGIDFRDTGTMSNVVEGNYIGVDATGAVALGNTGSGVNFRGGAQSNTIGGTTAGQRNIISANNLGIRVRDLGTDNNTILGNYIGTDVTGAVALGSTTNGIHIRGGASNTTIGGSAVGAGNVIAASGTDGIELDNTTNTVVQGNYIGTNAVGSAILGNTGDGIYIDNGASNNIIGGPASGAGNTIAYNGRTGLVLRNTAGIGNSILGNSIFSNTDLGIDLDGGTEDGFGVTANDVGDGDTGINNLQNFPLLSAAVTTGTQITIAGSLDTNLLNQNYRIEFFRNTIATGQDASSHGEGEDYLDFITVMTDGSGNATFNSTLSDAVADGEFITATATVDNGGGSYGDTSEFARNVVVTAVPVNNVPGAQSVNEDTVLVFNSANSNLISISDSDAGSNPLRVTLTATNGTMTLSQTTGLTFTTGDGTSDATMVFEGTLTNINAALDGLSFLGTLDFNGAADIQITTDDLTLTSLNEDSNLQGYYTFDNTGDLGNDDSPGGAHDGTVTGAVTNNDATRGNVLSLDGNDDYVDVTGAGALFGSPANLTLSAWVNYSSVDTFGGEVISLGNNVMLRVDDAVEGVTGVFYDGTTHQYVGSSTSLADGIWHHIAFTFDDAGNAQALYIDGVLAASDTATSSISYVNGSNTRIGANASDLDNDFDFNGLIDGARIYDRVLTATEIGNLASESTSTDTDNIAITVTAVNDAPIATNDPGDFNTEVVGLTPLSYWRLGEPSGSTAVDAGSSTNNGTYNGVTLGQTGALNGDINTAVRFNGSSDYVEIAHDPSYLLDNGSVQLWFNIDSLGSEQTLFSKDSLGLDTGGHLTMSVLADGRLEVRLQDASTSFFVRSSSSAVTAARWQHAAFTFGSGGMALYLDGQIVDTNSYTGGLGTTSGGSGNFEPIVIGADTGSSGNLVVTPLEEFFGGSIDEVAIFGSELSTGIIQDLYASGLGRYSVAEDGTLSVSASEGVLSNDTDADGDPLTAILVTDVTNGILNLNPNGSFTYTPDPDFNGSESFTYKVNDGTVDGNTVTVSIIVTAVPDNTVPGSQVVAEDTALGISGLAVNDVSGNLSTVQLSVSNGTLNVTLSGGVTISAGANGTDTLTLSGTQTDINTTLASLNYQGMSNYNGADSLTMRSTDANGATDVDTVAITVTAVNDAPVAADDPGDFNTELVGLSPLSYWRLGEPSGSTAVDVGSSGNNGTYNGVTLGQTGALTGDSNTAVRFNGSTDYLEIAHDPSYLLDNGSVQLWFNIDSLGSEQTLFSKDSLGFDTGGHLTMSVLADGRLEVRFQSASTSFFVRSSSSAVTAATWQHAAFTFGSGGMALYLDGQIVDTNSYTGGLGTTSGGSGNFEPIVIGADTGSSGNLVVTPLEEFFAGSIDEVAIFGSQLSDGNIQDLYTAGLQYYTIAEDSAIAVTASEGVLSNDYDGDGDSLTASVVTGPSNAASFTLNADGSFTYTPLANFNGTDSFTYQVSDGNGGMDTATATISITAVNDVPVNTVPGAQMVAEDTALNITGLLVNDVDGNLNTVQLGVTQGTVTVTLSGAATISAGGNGSSTLTLSGSQTDINATLASLSYRGNANYNGADTLTMTSTDGNSGTDVATVGITVTSVDDSAVVTGDVSYSGNEGDAVVGDMDATDVEGLTDGTYFSVTTPATNGTAGINAATGAWTFTPIDPNWVGADSFTVTVTDDLGGTTTQVVNITLANVNDPPVASNDTYTTLEDVPLTTTLATSVLANDSDVDLDTLTVNTTPIVNVANGTLLLNADGSFTYTPNAEFNGLDSFTYQITDGNGGSAQATVTLTVASMNDAPVITSQGGGVSANVILAENLSGVTTTTATDIEGDSLTYSIVGGADAARFTLDSITGALSFVVIPDFENPTDVGVDNVYDLQVQVSDGQGGTDTQSLAISVTDVQEGVAMPPGPEPTPEPEPEPTPESTPESEPAPDTGLPSSDTESAGAVNGTLAGGVSVGRGFEDGAHQPSHEEVVNVLDLPPLLRLASWATTSDQIRAYYPDPLDMAKTALSPDILQQLNQFSDELGKTMKDQAGERSWFLKTMKGAGLTLSAGFVGWMVRGGALVAGLMASLPAWRHFDPVPILKMNKQEKEAWTQRLKEETKMEIHEHQGLGQILHDLEQKESAPTASFSTETNFSKTKSHSKFS